MTTPMTKEALAELRNLEYCKDNPGAWLLGVKEVNEMARMLLAAMKQQPVALDYLQGHHDGIEWAAQLAEANHPQTGDWLYDDPIELAKAIRKGPDMPPSQPAPAVDADDNFYSWFGREWEQYYQPRRYSLSAKQHLGAIAESAWFACRAAMLQSEPVSQRYRLPDGWVMVPREPTIAMLDEFDSIIDYGAEDSKDAWARLIAAAPQQPQTSTASNVENP